MYGFLGPAYGYALLHNAPTNGGAGAGSGDGTDNGTGNGTGDGSGITSSPLFIPSGSPGLNPAMALVLPTQVVEEGTGEGTGAQAEGTGDGTGESAPSRRRAVQINIGILSDQRNVDLEFGDVNLFNLILQQGDQKPGMDKSGHKDGDTQVNVGIGSEQANYHISLRDLNLLNIIRQGVSRGDLDALQLRLTQADDSLTSQINTLESRFGDNIEEQTQALEQLRDTYRILGNKLGTLFEYIASIDQSGEMTALRDAYSRLAAEHNLDALVSDAETVCTEAQQLDADLLQRLTEGTGDGSSDSGTVIGEYQRLRTEALLAGRDCALAQQRAADAYDRIVESIMGGDSALYFALAGGITTDFRTFDPVVRASICSALGRGQDPYLCFTGTFGGSEVQQTESLDGTNAQGVVTQGTRTETTQQHGSAAVELLAPVAESLDALTGAGVAFGGRNEQSQGTQAYGDLVSPTNPGRVDESALGGQAYGGFRICSPDGLTVTMLGGYGSLTGGFSSLTVGYGQGCR